MNTQSQMLHEKHKKTFYMKLLFGRSCQHDGTGGSRGSSGQEAGWPPAGSGHHTLHKELSPHPDVLHLFYWPYFLSEEII